MPGVRDGLFTGLIGFYFRTGYMAKRIFQTRETGPWPCFMQLGGRLNAKSPGGKRGREIRKTADGEKKRGRTLLRPHLGQHTKFFLLESLLPTQTVYHIPPPWLVTSCGDRCENVSLSRPSFRHLENMGSEISVEPMAGNGKMTRLSFQSRKNIRFFP